MICPDPQCGANATLEVVSATPCQVFESWKVQGAERCEWDGMEIVDIVEVRCPEGHRFKGPAEMLDRREAA